MITIFPGYLQKNINDQKERLTKYVPDIVNKLDKLNYEFVVDLSELENIGFYYRKVLPIRDTEHYTHRFYIEVQYLLNDIVATAPSECRHRFRITLNSTNVNQYDKSEFKMLIEQDHKTFDIQKAELLFDKAIETFHSTK